MKTSTFVHFSAAQKGSSSHAPIKTAKTRHWQFPQIGQLSCLGFALATFGIGIAADPGQAQVVYYERPVSTTIPGDGVVATASGIGLNVRSGPGLSYPVIGGAYDGTLLELQGPTRAADGYTWREISTGGWVATEYVTGDSTVDVAYDACGRPVAVSACGGPAETAPVIRPIAYRPVAASSGAYVAAVPGSSPETLARVRRVVRGAYVDRAREGSFVNAGGYPDYDGANALVSLLRAQGLDARVIYK